MLVYLLIAYYILDEIIMAGELQEASKRVVMRVCSAQDALMEERSNSGLGIDDFALTRRRS